MAEWTDGETVSGVLVHPHHISEVRVDFCYSQDSVVTFVTSEVMYQATTLKLERDFLANASSSMCVLLETFQVMPCDTPQFRLYLFCSSTMYRWH